MSRTGQVGEWGANKKEAAGVMKHTAPDTLSGATKSLSTGKRFWCAVCHKLETVVSVQTVVQHEESAEYFCTLSCLHTRQIVTAVSRTPSGKARLTAEKEQAELQDIRADLESEQLL